MGVRLSPVVVFLAALASAPLALASAPAAQAQPTASSNWAGYAIHRPGTRFRVVEASWRQPGARCRAGDPTYSSFWVGLGGYNVDSGALEQVGTELDCTRSGQPRLSAWYELVPNPAVPIAMPVHPGDAIGAGVLVSGHDVSLSLVDFTSRRSFTKRMWAPVVDVSSAEWIVEAPSACLSANDCFTLPLANFGSAQFDSALAETVTGRRGSISDPAWYLTQIELRPGGRQMVTGPSTGAASPGPLAAGGRSFTVSFSNVRVTARRRLAHFVASPSSKPVR